MTTETPHLGTMLWTRGPNEENLRPMVGAQAAEKARIDWWAKREQDLLTPEGQKWLEKHGEI
jgi:hypothetical protein